MTDQTVIVYEGREGN